MKQSLWTSVQRSGFQLHHKNIMKKKKKIHNHLTLHDWIRQARFGRQHRLWHKKILAADSRITQTSEIWQEQEHDLRSIQFFHKWQHWPQRHVLRAKNEKLKRSIGKRKNIENITFWQALFTGMNQPSVRTLCRQIPFLLYCWFGEMILVFVIGFLRMTPLLYTVVG